jgi:ATP-binding cassette subfamily B (MDR/TAP) protein 1|mmetsp:Transcript_11191/g.15069  ORF Transcript_11191/g.15069 Transcript_11191/m.15069 type:complete len:145 (-) Transcript_11191:1533-1967(-)
MGLVSAILFIAKGSSGIFLAQVAENITMGVRTDLYNSIIRKDIGWHDQRDNSAGVMTATLASDVQLLNGVSSEGLAVMVEAMSALATAFIGGGIFSWPMMLVGLAVVPLIVICGTIAAKADNEAMMNVKEQESSDDKTDDQKAS